MRALVKLLNVTRALHGLRPRERRFSLIVAVAIGCYGLISGVIVPLWEQGKQLRTHTETQSEKLRSISRLLASAGTVEHWHQAFAPYLEREEEDRMQQTYLAELESLSRESGIALNLKPHSARQVDHASRFDVEVDAEGSQQQLLEFLDALLKLQRLMTIERIRIATVPAKESLLRATLALQYVSLSPQQ